MISETVGDGAWHIGDIQLSVCVYPFVTCFYVLQFPHP